jgi:predicted SAM-dependent methyltransferase
MRLLNLGCGGRHHPEWINVDSHSTGPGVMVHDLESPFPFEDSEFDAVYHSHLLEHLPKRRAPLFLRECYRVLKPGGILRVVVPDLEQIARLYLQYLEKAMKGEEEAQYRYEWILLEMFDQMVRNQSGGEMLNYWKRDPMPAEPFVIDRVGREVLDLLPLLRQPPPTGDGDRTGGPPPENLERDPLKIGIFRLSGEVHKWMYDRYSLGKLLRETGFQDIKDYRAEESGIPDFARYRLDPDRYANRTRCSWRPRSLEDFAGEHV